MTFVLLVAITTATFAWYSASSTAIDKTSGMTAQSISAETTTKSLGGIKIVASVTGGSLAAKKVTDRSGLTYYYSGSNKTLWSELELADKQGSGTFTVKITDANNAEITDVDLLAQYAGSYTVVLTASGSAKLGLVATTTLGTDDDEDKEYDTNEEANGVLGLDAGAVINVMKITISDTGVITVWTNATAQTPFSGDGSTKTAAEMYAGVATATFYYGVEVNDASQGEDTVSVAENTKITPSISQ